MRFFPLALLSGVVLSGCGADSFIAPPPPPPPALFTIHGVVRDLSGLPVSGATIELVGYNLFTTTDEAGRYQFPGVQGGQITLGVRKPGYLVQLVTAFVSGATTLDILFQPFALSDSLVIGETVTIEGGWGPPCDPVNWDAGAPCRKLYFNPTEDGTLSLVLTWNDGSASLDFVVVTELGAYIAIPRESEPGVMHLEVGVRRGERYQVRVNAYYAPQVFTLWAAFAPES